MSIKARLRIAIVALVALVVIAMSALYLYDFTTMTFTGASERADSIAKDVKGNLADHLQHETEARGLKPVTLDEWKHAWTEIIRSDPSVTAMLKRTLGDSKLVADIILTDDQGQVLASSGPALPGLKLSPVHDFRALDGRSWMENLRDLMTRREDYSTTLPVGISANNQQVVLFNITVLIQSVFLKHDVYPTFKILGLTFASALFIAIFLGSVLPNVMLDPLERLTRSIDMIRAGQFDKAVLPLQRESSEFAVVHSKLSLLGEQFRGARQDALDLRSNVEQLLEKLEEAVLFFDNTGRLAMAGEAAERILGRSHEQLIGKSIEDVFPRTTLLGGVIAQAVETRESVQAQPVTIARDGAGSNGSGNVRLLVSVEVLRKGPRQDQMGTLVKLRDVDSRRQLERQLDVSSRLAAISRLTGGVAHEIKNPLNAIALHLEVLRSRLETEQPEVDVIAREIKRLDNVVKTFLTFNKPIELQAVPVDLDQLVKQVVALVSVHAEAKNVQIETKLTGRLWLNGDPDLLKQAVLNVVNNGLEAMPQGGKLLIQTEWVGDDCQVRIADGGVGIPADVQDRIFNLYFTTKPQGSGIGLATTFRVVQLHSGTIDFVSEPGRGTTFRLRFPGMTDYHGEARTSATTSS
ncbi:MAG TPA: ATP-binding protein [Bryobacteraceae bacterium]|nr:ATP-binding protein [Bryobacteraceae bacterium]